ncbi:hypothetical protein GTP81_26555 [Rugamonas sp. FT107W]|uniref:Uncharacterized protein n=1 Tax=Duganella vulcania TaxID=2692166 RepID=A0A845HNZ2_9BURK|nr:hypothetical protein [Duganella vulcania]MYN20307.1 hypothetical protein [Duganella vulcania]
MTWFKHMSALVLAVSMMAGGHAAPVRPVSAQAELRLKYGSNEVKAGDMVLHIVRGFVGNLSASGFDTFTVYVLPEKAEEPWLLVTAPAPKGIGFNLRNYETADANIQSISFYKDGGQLYAVEAVRNNVSGPGANLKKAGVDFHVYKFNQDWDVPMFNEEAVMHAKSQYQDASEALKKEFYLR